jgi:hypothetical protein
MWRERRPIRFLSAHGSFLPNSSVPYRIFGVFARKSRGGFRHTATPAQRVRLVVALAEAGGTLGHGEWGTGAAWVAVLVSSCAVVV